MIGQIRAGPTANVRVLENIVEQRDLGMQIYYSISKVPIMKKIMPVKISRTFEIALEGHSRGICKFKPIQQFLQRIDGFPSLE